MAELVDAHVSGACVLTGVGVRLPLSALYVLQKPVIQAGTLDDGLLRFGRATFEWPIVTEQ